jgi:hypothetical protein
MDKHTLEIAASAFGFLGGAVLSLDALRAVSRARSEKGKSMVNEAIDNAKKEPHADDPDKLKASAYALQLLIARRSALAARIGFGLVTLGFLLDLISKLCAH